MIEDCEVKYVPQAEINCVWVRDIHNSVFLVGHLPRPDLTEEDIDLPDWVYSVKDYNDGKEERIYQVRIGPISQFLAEWISSKVEKHSFGIAGIEVY